MSEIAIKALAVSVKKGKAATCHRGVGEPSKAAKTKRPACWLHADPHPGNDEAIKASASHLLSISEPRNPAGHAKRQRTWVFV